MELCSDKRIDLKVHVEKHMQPVASATWSHPNGNCFTIYFQEYFIYIVDMRSWSMTILKELCLVARSRSAAADGLALA